MRLQDRVAVVTGAAGGIGSRSESVCERRRVVNSS